MSSSVMKYILSSFKAYLIYIIAICLITACTDSSKLFADSNVIAVIGDKTISNTELAEKTTQRSGGYHQNLSDEKLKNLVLNEMLEREVQIIAAKKAGYDATPEIITAVENLMIAKLRREQLEAMQNKITISSTDIESYYQVNIDKYTQPSVTQVAIIYFALSPFASNEKRMQVERKAEEVFKLSQSLPASVYDFGTLAAKYSEHQSSRYQGGKIKWTSATQQSVSRELLNAAASLSKKGELAPIVKSIDGYYLVKFLKRKNGQEKPLKLVKSDIERVLLRKKRQQLEQEWLKGLQSNITPFVIHNERVTSLKVNNILKHKEDSVQPPQLPQ